MKNPVLLCIETSGKVCSASLLCNGEITEKSLEEVNAHSRVLAPMVDELFRDSKLTFTDLDAVVVSAGPGSYTGLRIGASLAKGICFARELPLLSVSSLRAIAVRAKEQYAASKYISLIDARREDVYMGMYNSELETIVEEKFISLNDEEIAQLKIDKQTVICGSGESKLKQLFPELNYISCSESTVYSRHLVKLGLAKWEAKEFEDLTYFEPNYIKSVFVTKPKPKF